MAARRHTRGRSTGGVQSPNRVPFMWGGVVAVVVAVLAIGVAVITTGGAAAPPEEIIVPPARAENGAGDAHSLGAADAPVVVTEYLDFQCPFCQWAAFSVLPPALQPYLETGEVRFEVVPIAILGEESVQAAAAAECAAAQGDFWGYYDILFANQGAENSGAFSDARLKEMAAAIGLDTAEFDACLGSDEYRQTVMQATVEAYNSGIAATPTVLVDGREVETSVEAITAAIEQALAE